MPQSRELATVLVLFSCSFLDLAFGEELRRCREKRGRGRENEALAFRLASFSFLSALQHREPDLKAFVHSQTRSSMLLPPLVSPSDLFLRLRLEFSSLSPLFR
ncbi:hypothetical protein OPV22_006995 [Ensete ventricosum]|uniref:Secreted protein n=1 Tax=Ensete ventricosum TaxID=4639 RepID=A0AAV8RP98_ENSVE|nr:hypothetical protein OPV22_006995 [Ensete ventricosum]